MLAAKQPDASMILKYCVLLASLGLAGPAWAQGVDALPGPVHAATLELRAQAWAFRPGTSTGCAAEAGAGRLAVLDLETGTVVGTHPLDRPASLLVTAPGGQWLVASMPPAPESGSTEADVALLDWIGGGIRSTFHVRVLPSGVAVTDAGLVVVSDSVPMRVPDYFGLIVCYDGLSGVERGFCGNSVGSSVALGVDQRTVFGGEYDTVRQFALDPITGELTIVDYSPQQSYPTAVEYGLHVLPDGQHLVSRGGRLHPGVGMGVVLDTAHRFESVSGDAANRAFFVVGVNRQDSSVVRLFQYHSETFQMAAQYALDPVVRQVHVAGDRLYLVGSDTDRTTLLALPNPALGGNTNQPPVPEFAWSPVAPTTQTPVEFDASGTQDESPSDVWFRWDWNGDGGFDTGWTNRSTATHQFLVAGPVTVVLEAKDRFGLVGRTTRTLTVAQAGDPGTPAAAHTPFRLPFAARDVAFLADRPVIYAADLAGRRMVRVNLADGLAEREFALDKYPQSLAATPDGTRLYAILWTTTRPAYTAAAHLAEFDLTTGVKTREMPIDRSIDGLMATGGPTLLGTGSGREIVSYSQVDGHRILGRAMTGSGTMTLVPHALGTNFYVLFSGALGGAVDRYALDPATGQFAREGTIPDASNAGGRLFALPGGTNTLARSGRLLINTSDWRTDLRLWKTLHTGVVEAASLDLSRHALFLLGTPTAPANRTNLYHYHSDSHLLLGTYIVTNGARNLKAYPDYVYAFSTNANSTAIQRLPNPAQGGETNVPPVGAFAVAPSHLTTLTPAVFDASDTTDNEGAAGGLQYRWDFESDGLFDTAFGSAPTWTNRFNLAGSWTVTLEVRDRFGAVDVAHRTVEVTLEEDPGQPPATANPPFELPFAAADIVFDPARPFLYATDLSGRRMSRMNLETGAIDREYGFVHLPNLMAISRDARTLGLTLLCLPNYAAPPGTNKGYIAGFDLERGVKTHEFPLSTVPHDLAVSSAGYAVVSGPGLAGVHAFRLGDGQPTYAGPPYSNLRLASHPSEEWLYGVTYGSSGVSVYRFDWGADGVLVYQGGVGHEVLSDWVEVLDTGSHFVSGVGGLFAASSVLDEDRGFVRMLDPGWVFDAATDVGHEALFVAGQTFEGRPYVRCYSLLSFELAREFPVPPATRYVHVAGPVLYHVSVGASASVVSRVVHPAFEVTLSSRRSEAGASIEVVAAGWPGRGFVLEGSTDLREWHAVSTNRFENGLVVFSFPPPRSSAVFYRAWVAE